MRDQIAMLLVRSDRAVARALVTLYGLQTADEQRDSETRLLNQRGFNSWDAPLLSSLARQVHERQAAGRPDLLSGPELWLARNKLHKYAGQLARVAEAETKPVTV